MNERIKNLIKKHGLSGVNSPKKTPSHPTKKGIVLAKEGDRYKLIRFGDQNMGHNYSPEARKSFKARHAQNIAKGKMSAAYWADKAFWGGPGADKKMPPKSQQYTRGLKKYQDGGRVKRSGTVTGPTVVVSAAGKSYPYYNILTPEERRFFDNDSPIGRGVRAIATTGKRGQTANELSRVAKNVGGVAAEMTGIPGAIRFSKDPVKNLKGAGKTLEATILGSSPFIRAPYNKEDVEGAFNTLDVAGLATLPLSAAKTPLTQAARTGGKFLTRTPLKNAYKLNPNAAKQPAEVILSRVQKPGQTATLSRLEELLQKPSKNLTLAERIELAKLNQPGYGRGFSSNPSDISYYSSPGIQSSRGYVGMPEIRSIRLPFGEAARFNVGQNPVAGYISGAPKREYLLPRKYVESSQSLKPKSFEELEQIRRAIEAEQTALNTPHWLRGYKKVSKPTSVGYGNIGPVASENIGSVNFSNGGKVATKTNPSLWERAKAQAKAKMGGKHSARAMQLAVSIYKKAGGGYKGAKGETSLSKWTKQDWTTSSGKPSEGKRRYLPKAAWAALSSAQKAATNKAKAEGNRQGKQFVPQPKSIAKKTAQYR